MKYVSGRYPVFPMYKFWDTIIRPAFEAFHPRSIVEIGVEEGFHTMRLLEYCRDYHAVLHAIDPTPRASIESWLQEQGQELIFHRDLSLNVLGRIDAIDTVLIDGDHNWYTVYHELKLLEKQVTMTGKFPVIFLHDTQWPYARRDLYYNPETIPAAYQKAFARKGIGLESGLLLEKGGINPSMCNAVEEHALQNGVLTAIEDFLAESTLQLRFVNVPGIHGLGIIASEDLLTQYPEFSAFLHALQAAPALKAHMEAMEKERVTFFIDLLAVEQESAEALQLQQKESSEILHAVRAEAATLVQRAEEDAALHIQSIREESVVALVKTKQDATLALQAAEERMARTLQSVREASTIALQKAQEKMETLAEILRAEFVDRATSAHKKYLETLEQERTERAILQDGLRTMQQQYRILEETMQRVQVDERRWKEEATKLSLELTQLKQAATALAQEQTEKKETTFRQILRDSGYLMIGDMRRLWVACGSPFPKTTRAIRSHIFGSLWPIRPPVPVEDIPATVPDTEKPSVTLCIALSGRTWAWPITARFLETQTYPHSAIHLCIQDTSQDDAFHAMIRTWLDTCDYASAALMRTTVGQKGLADEDRDVYSRDVAATCSEIYQTFARVCTTPLVFILEDDIEPNADVYVHLTRHVGGTIASVAAWYLHRGNNDVVAWDVADDGSTFAVQPRFGISPIGGNGFGCVVLEGDTFRRGNFASAAPYHHFDFAFYAGLRASGKTALIDWSERCTHYASATIWK